MKPVTNVHKLMRNVFHRISPNSGEVKNCSK